VSSLKSLQVDAAAAVEARPWFSGVPVIIDTGRARDALEEAMGAPRSGGKPASPRGNGVAVLVGMPLGIEVADNIRKTVSGEATLTVELWVNPERNAETHRKDILEGLGELMLALVSEPTVPGRNDMAIQGADLITSETGLLVYVVTVTRPVFVS